MRFFKDPSFWLVFGANVVTMVQAVVQQWDGGEVLWTFWVQSVIIGLFAAARLCRMGSWGMAGFLLLHYGFFHLVYAFFLMDFAFPPAAGLLFSTGSFLLAHGASAFVVYPTVTTSAGQDAVIGTFLRPYARVIPMHLTIIFFQGFLGGGAAFGLLLLKMIVDLAAHVGIHLADEKRW